MTFKFPSNFTWGAATAAYQIEGAVEKDGRGKSTWDVFCDEKGRIENGDSGAIACNHYNLWREDIALMQSLNLNSYRFSLAWSRIFPNGEGKPNEAGAAFYDRLIDGLLEAHITPWITLFHWDLPFALQQQYGGWSSRETVDRFADYAAYCARRFGDRVKQWFTINEITCFTALAHLDDRFAPGGKLSVKQTNQTIHHALLGHGRAIQSIRNERPDAQVGLVENLRAVWPLYEDSNHIQAAKRAFRDFNIQRLFPSINGVYDDVTYRRVYGDFPDVEDGDIEIIGTKADYIAYNYYFSDPIVAASNEQGYQVLNYPTSHPTTAMGWYIAPKGLYWTLRFSQDYFPEKPIYIAENGQAANDVEEKDGNVWDVDRLEFYRSHLEQSAQAIADGCDLRGYFAWSLMDNFEWAAGYSKRFGLVRINYRTQERSIKASGRYYADVIRANRVL